MKEQVISFETAKLAKEKGFDWVSYTYYYNSDDYEEYPNDNIYIYRLGYNKSNKETNSNYDIYEAVSAPTQSLLQRWVWETHSIWVQSTPIFTANECIGVSVTISSWRFPVINVNYVGFDVYDGLENGLFEALKLI